MLGQLSRSLQNPSLSASFSASNGHVSQASPTASKSESCCEGFATDGQLSQRLPTPSRSVSVCVLSETSGQLSIGQVLAGNAGLPKPSWSGSVHESQASATPSWSGSCCAGW